MTVMVAFFPGEVSAFFQFDELQGFDSQLCGPEEYPSDSHWQCEDNQISISIAWSKVI
jgi:hypothetical protein